MDIFSMLMKVGFDKSTTDAEYKKLIVELKKNKFDITPSIDFAKSKQEAKKQVSEIAKIFEKKLNLDPKDANRYANQYYGELLKGIKSVEKEQVKLNSLQQQKISDGQSKYYGRIKDNLKEIYNLEKKLPSAKKEETAEIRDQIKLLEKRNSNNYGAIDRKGLKDNSLQWEINNTKVLYESRLKVNNAKNVDTSNVSNIKKETNAVKERIAAEKKVQTEIQKRNSLELQKGRTSSNIDTFVKQNSKMSKESVNNFRELQKTINGVNAKGLQDVNTQLSTLKNRVKENGEMGRNFFGELKNNAGKVANWLGATGIIFAGINGIRQAVTELKEVDTILTEISKTSDRTEQSLKNLGASSVGVANKYGATISGYLQGVQEMSRAGFSESQAEGLGEVSSLAQSAGDMTSELANKYLIATNFAYDYKGSVEKLNGVLDAQNQITNRNALNMSDLAEATKVSASQAADSGVAIDQMTASVGTMMAVTQQGGEVAGRAFKGILMNIQQVAGETDDGDIIDEESLKKVEARLHSVGVESEYMKDGIATLREPMTVLKELAQVYNSLPENSADKAGIIADIGGRICHVMQKCITRTYLNAGNA